MTSTMLSRVSTWPKNELKKGKIKERLGECIPKEMGCGNHGVPVGFPGLITTIPRTLHRLRASFTALSSSATSRPQSLSSSK